MERLRIDGSEQGANAAAIAALRAVGPRIYVACLAAYNNGILHGAWIDAAQDTDEIWAEVSVMLKDSPIPSAEEWAIHDFEGFGAARIEEYSSFEYISRLAEFLSVRGEALGGQILSHFSGDLDEANAAFEDYAGCFASLAMFMQDLTEDTMTIPENLALYIDYEAMGRDAELNGDLFTIETGFEDIHIFWSR